MAHVGFQIDSSQVDPAVAKLKRLTEAAAGTGSAADQLRAKTGEAAAGVARITQAANQSGTAIQGLINKTTGVANAMKAAGVSAQSFTLARQEADNLRASVDPLFAASKRYEAALAQLNEQQKLGIVTEREAAQTAKLMADRYLGAGAVMASTSAKIAGGFRLNRIGMLEMQAAGINTFQALAAGMNPMQVAMMESSQVVGAFVQGTEGGLAAIKAAVISTFTNPFTIGIAAVTALAGAALYLGGVFEKAGPTLQDFHDKMKDLDSIQTAYTRAVQDAQTPLAQLREKFGQNAEAAQRLYGVTAMLEKLQFAAEFAKQVATMDVALQGLKSRASAIIGLQEMLKSGQLGDTALPGSMGTTGADAAHQQIASMAADLKQQYGVTIDQAKQLAEALRQIDKAASQPAKNAALDHFGMLIGDIVAKTKDASPALIQLGEDAAKLARKGYLISDSMSASADNSGRLGHVDISSGIKSAADAATTMAMQLSHSLAFAQGIADIGSGANVPSMARSGAGGGALNFPSNSPWQIGRTGMAPSSSPYAAGTVIPGTGHATSGGHAASVKRLTDQERLQKQMLNDLGVGTKSYTEQLKALNAIQDKISASQYSYELQKITLAAQDANPQIKSLKDTLSTGWNTFFGDIRKGEGVFKSLADAASHALDRIASKLADQALSNLFLGGGPSGTGGFLGAIGSLFGIKANAMGGVYAGPGISAYSGQVVSQPTLFPFAKGTGLMGEAGPEGIFPLSRGSDGKLGVKAQGMDGGQGKQPSTMHLHVTVNGARGNTEIRQMVAEGVSAGISHYDSSVLPISFHRVAQNPDIVGG